MFFSAKLLESARRFLGRNRFSLAIVCGLAALFMYRYQAELDAPPLASVEVQEVLASAVGRMEVRVLGRRENVAVARRDAGYGIEYTALQSASPRAVRPTRTAFASELLLTQAEVNWIRGHGPNYRIGVLGQRVVFIDSMAQPLIRYERYVKIASSRRTIWKVLTGCTLLLGGVFYVAGRLFHARVGG